MNYTLAFSMCIHKFASIKKKQYLPTNKNNIMASKMSMKKLSIEELQFELRRRELSSKSKKIYKEEDCEECFKWNRYKIPVTMELTSTKKKYLKEIKNKSIIQEIKKRQKVLYGINGTDDRQDINKVTNARLLLDSESVVAVIPNNSISDNGDGTSTISGQNYGTKYNLCSTERFKTQPSIANCTGFLVDPSFIVTAGHCIQESTLQNFKFVFGFEVEGNGNIRTQIDNNDIYEAIRLIGRRLESSGPDWAIVQLDRPVLDRPPVEIRRTGTIIDKQEVHVIGHPSGLPKKVAGNANVRENSDDDFFVANLDTYGGNSGSPVFNSVTHIVEGILVRGETDYMLSGSCYISNICSDQGCRGEDCTRIKELSHLIPLQGVDCIPFSHSNAKVENARGRWKITSNRMWLLDFDNSKTEADKALKVIKHYNLNSQCFIGRPNASLSYFLTDGQAPSGRMKGEDSIKFDRDKIEVKRVGGRWKIIEDNHWILDFNQSQEEARQALSKILEHEFTHICFVGRPNASMTYFRK